MTHQNKGSRTIVWLAVGAGIVALASAALVNRGGPTATHEAAATIMAAERVRATQPTSADVKLDESPAATTQPMTGADPAANGATAQAATLGPSCGSTCRGTGTAQAVTQAANQAAAQAATQAANQAASEAAARGRPQ